MSYVKTPGGLTNSMVAAAMAEFVTRVIHGIPLPPGAGKQLFPKITAEGWREGDAYVTKDAMNLGERIFEVHQVVAARRLAKKIGVGSFPSEHADQIMGTWIQEMILGIAQGDAGAIELGVWFRKNNDDALLETLCEVFSGPVDVTMEHGFPIHLKRVEE